MFDKLDAMKQRFNELTEEIGKSEVIANQELWQKLVKEHAELQEIVEKYDAYLENEKQIGELREMLHDPESADMAEMIEEELAELQEALASGDGAAAENELGDVLFALVNYARHQKIEPEVALNGTNNRFAKRFAHVESCVEASGKVWQDFSLEELDQFWDEAKRAEKQE